MMWLIAAAMLFALLKKTEVNLVQKSKRKIAENTIVLWLETALNSAI